MAGGLNGDGLTRRERERQAHRREILEAAERVFVRDGYQAATVERIAQEAEFAVGTLYNFFESKEKLFEEVIARLANEAFERLEEEVFCEEDPVAAIEALIHIRLAYPQEHREFGQLFLEVAPAARTALLRLLPESCRDLHARYLQKLAEVIRRGIDARVFRDEDPTLLGLCIEGALQAVGLDWMQGGTGKFTQERLEAVKRILLAMICVPREEHVEGRAT